MNVAENGLLILIPRCPIMVFHILMYIMCVPNMSRVPVDNISIVFWGLKQAHIWKNSNDMMVAFIKKII